MCDVLGRMIRGSTSRPSTSAFRTSFPEIDTGFSPDGCPSGRRGRSTRRTPRTHLERLDREVAAELLEDLLRVEVTPDRRAVVVGGRRRACGR
jgi:hypothetical protein